MDGALIVQQNLAADDVSLTLEQSVDLRTWSPSEILPSGETPTGDGAVQTTYPLDQAGASYFRIRAVGR